MVRIAKLVRDTTQTPATTDNGRTDAMRFSDGAKLGSTEGTATLRFDQHFSPGSRNFYLTAQNYIQEVREKFQKGQEITLERPLAMIDQMIAEPSLIDEIYQMTVAGGHGSDMYIASPVNSMIYSFKIGIRMGYTPAMLTEISLAALHHDIGMFLIPGEITHKDSRLTDAEFSIVKKHTEAGRDRLAGLGYPNVGRAIYEHHERQGGGGYPAGIKGEEICEYAKIIGICDSYEAMTHDRPYKKATAQHLSVLQLAESKDLLFAPHIVKIFLDEITLYPIGSFVRLNNKAVGVVVKTNPSNPLKPTVRILVDGHGSNVAEEKLINLAETNILIIIAGVAADEIAA